MTSAQVQPSNGSRTRLDWKDSHLPRIPEKSTFPLLSSLCTRGLDSTQPTTMATDPGTSTRGSLLLTIGLGGPVVTRAKSSARFRAAMCTPSWSRSSTTITELCNSTGAWGLLANTTRSPPAVAEESPAWARTKSCKGISIKSKCHLDQNKCFGSTNSKAQSGVLFRCTCGYTGKSGVVPPHHRGCAKLNNIWIYG